MSEIGSTPPGTDVPPKPPRKKPGPPKGKRYGGRQKNTRNKATVERELKAQLEVERQELEARARAAGSQLMAAQAAGKKLAKEVLSEFMQLFASMAAYYQPVPAGADVAKNDNENEGKFKEYATLAVDAAKGLAPFQSPRYSAVMIGAATVTKVKVTGGMPDDFAPPAQGQVTFEPGTVITAEEVLPVMVPKIA